MKPRAPSLAALALSDHPHDRPTSAIPASQRRCGLFPNSSQQTTATVQPVHSEGTQRRHYDKQERLKCRESQARSTADRNDLVRSIRYQHGASFNSEQALRSSMDVCENDGEIDGESTGNDSGTVSVSVHPEYQGASGSTIENDLK